MVLLFPKEVTENYLLDFYGFLWDLSNVSWPNVQANSSHFKTEFDIIVILSSISTESPDYRLWILWFIRDFESFEIICWGLTKYSQEGKKKSLLVSLTHKHNMETRSNPNVLAPHGHIPFPGLTDEVVWEAFWPGEITLLNGDVKSNVVSWKFPASTWEWSSWKSHGAWKHFPSEKHFQFPHRAKCNNSPDIIITKGKKSFMQTCCCNLGIYKLHPLHNLKAMWLKMEPTQKRGLLVKAMGRFQPSLSKSDRDRCFLSYLRHFLKIGLFLSICNIYP